MTLCTSWNRQQNRNILGSSDVNQPKQLRFDLIPDKDGCFANCNHRWYFYFLSTSDTPLYSFHFLMHIEVIVSDHYSFENTGFRFSRKALMASFRSLDLSIAAFHVATCSRPCSTVTSLLLSKTALVPITAHADFSAISEMIGQIQFKLRINRSCLRALKIICS